MIEQKPGHEGTAATADTIDTIDTVATDHTDDTVATGNAVAIDNAVDTVTDAAPADADGFDRARVMRLIDQLERDIATVEVAMAQVEAGEHEAFAATVAPLELRFVD